MNAYVIRIDPVDPTDKESNYRVELTRQIIAEGVTCPGHVMDDPRLDRHYEFPWDAALAARAVIIDVED